MVKFNKLEMRMPSDYLRNRAHPVPEFAPVLGLCRAPKTLEHVVIQPAIGSKPSHAHILARTTWVNG